MSTDTPNPTNQPAESPSSPQLSLREQIFNRLLGTWTDKTSADVADEIVEMVTALLASTKLEKRGDRYDSGVTVDSVQGVKSKLIIEETTPKETAYNEGAAAQYAAILVALGLEKS